MYDFVLPLRAKNKRWNETERVEILRDTFKLYCPEANFIIISPRDEQSHWKKVMPGCNYLADEDLTQTECRGWVKQQFIKLLAYKYVNTDAYCLLDSDIFLCKPLCEVSLKRDDKPVLAINDELGPMNRQWAEGVSEYLGTEPLEETIHYTPVVFSVTAVKYVLYQIRNRIGENWEEVLAKEDPPWSEYSFYLACLREYDLVSKFHTEIHNPIHQSFSAIMDLIHRDINRSLVLVNSDVGIYPPYIREVLEERGILKGD